MLLELKWVETLDWRAAGASLHFEFFPPLSIIVPLSNSYLFNFHLCYSHSGHKRHHEESWSNVASELNRQENLFTAMYYFT